ncbi:MAG: serine hydrolase domain-containing protein [Sandaracinaceae bacterium]
MWRSLLMLSVAASACSSAPLPRSGPHAEDAPPGTITALDDSMRRVMADHGLPGGQVVIVRGEETLASRAYGIARRDPQTPVTDATLFRIASVTKPITAVTLHLMAAEGLVSLDAPLLDHLGPLPIEPSDARWRRITLRHLLEHSGGFDRHETFDPMFASQRICEATECDGPAELDDILRVMLALPLDFDPGEDYAYSNFGYSLLGRVIEQVSGQPYEAEVRRRVLEPSGASSMRLGQTRPERRPAQETHYFANPGEARSPSVFPGEGEVPTPDGGFYLPPMAAHGGWIANATDVAQVFLRLDGRPAPADLLDEDGLEGMLARPGHPAWRELSFHYGHGLFVTHTDDPRSWWHDGSKPGTTALALICADRTVAVALFNSRPVRGDVSADLDKELRNWVAASASRASTTASAPEVSGF